MNTQEEHGGAAIKQLRGLQFRTSEGMCMQGDIVPYYMTGSATKNLHKGQQEILSSA